MCPRSLPLTCTTSCRVSCTSALSSTLGQRASITASAAELAPEHVADVRSDGRQQQDHGFQAFLDQGAVLGVLVRRLLQHVHQGHHRGDGGVELVVLADILAGLPDRQVDGAADLLRRSGRRRPARREAGADMGVSQAPDAAEEAVGASTPASDHSRLMSGGEANIMNRRQVSAPYWSIIDCGSTPLFFDFDIFSVPPISTG